MEEVDQDTEGELELEVGGGNGDIGASGSAHAGSVGLS